MVWLIIQGVIFGVVTNIIIKNKGYEENWFWWGFFFSFFAVIVAATKPENRATKENPSNPGTSPVTPKPLVTEDLNVNDMLNKVDIKSPVQIVSWKIQQENDDFMLLIDFMNVSENIVTAVMFTVVGYNSFSDKVLVDGKDEFEVLGQDYSIHQGMKGTVKHKLPSADIRKVNLQIKKVCFSDSMIYNHKESEFIPTQQHPIDDKYSECLTRANLRGKYYAVMRPEYWQCVCGFVNTGNSCVMCHMAKDQATKYTEESIETSYQAFVKEQAEQHQKDEEAERTKQEHKDLLACNRKKRILIIAGVVVMMGVSSLVCKSASNTLIPRYKYLKATGYMKAKDYPKAISALENIDYKDSKRLLDEAHYQTGIQEYQKGNYRDAKNEFRLSYSYKDSQTLFIQSSNWVMIERAKELIKDGTNENYLIAYNYLNDINDLTEDQLQIVDSLKDTCLSHLH